MTGVLSILASRPAWTAKQSRSTAHCSGARSLSEAVDPRLHDSPWSHGPTHDANHFHGMARKKEKCLLTAQCSRGTGSMHDALARLRVTSHLKPAACHPY